MAHNVCSRVFIIDTTSAIIMDSQDDDKFCTESAAAGADGTGRRAGQGGDGGRARAAPAEGKGKEAAHLYNQMLSGARYGYCVLLLPSALLLLSLTPPPPIFNSFRAAAVRERRRVDPGRHEWALVG